jgi:hypothetical protein
MKAFCLDLRLFIKLSKVDISTCQKQICKKKILLFTSNQCKSSNPYHMQCFFGKFLQLCKKSSKSEKTHKFFATFKDFFVIFYLKKVDHI